MTGKKKSMDGGRSLINRLFKRPTTDTTQVLNNSNKYLIEIKNLVKIYNSTKEKYININEKISVNNLNKKVRLFTDLSSRNKLTEHEFLLKEVEKNLIEIIIKRLKSLNDFILTELVYNIDFLQLLDILKEFEKLLNLLKLLNQSKNFSIFNVNENSFINEILRKYEKYIEDILYKNPRIDILKQLLQQVQKYIRLYTEFIDSMTNNRKINNPISKIIDKFNILSDQISIKIELLHSQGTNNAEYQVTNAMKRRINLLYDANRSQKGINYNSILGNLHGEYQNKTHEYNLTELSSLADIGSKIESIKRMRNSNNKKILLRDLRETIKQLKNSLNKYPKFQEYEKIIESISAQ